MLRERRPNGHHRVTAVELFFDLVFVFAITQISHTMLAHFTPLGVAQTAILFLAVWWVWIFTAWVTNWAEYDAALRQRGSLTVWFTDAAIAAWRAEPRTTRGGQPYYSTLAITTALTLRAVFRLALRQTEGLIGSIIRLLGLDLAVLRHQHELLAKSGCEVSYRS